MLLVKLQGIWCCSLVSLSFIQVTLADLPNPAPGDFLRRAYHSLAVVNDYLYIDGGSVSQRVGGVVSPERPMNDTLSISLKESWTNKSAKLNVIPKSAPIVDRSVLWEDPSQEAFYMWGGGSSSHNLTGYTYLWKFQGDGLGKGTWSTSDPANSENFYKIIRTYGASYAVCERTGAYLSGTIAEWVTGDKQYGSLAGGIAILTPGLVTYDFESKMWENITTVPTNDSTPGLNSFGTQIYGRAACASSFGEKGIFISIGGTIGPIGEQNDSGREWFQSMAEISFYDIASKTWHKQSTTSDEDDIPRLRDRLCITGVQSPNNTYEIFMYGGYQRGANTTLDDVWVLTVPGFRWFKGPTGVPRSRHICATIGNRQMVIVGGYGKSVEWNEPDELTQGIGIFDMTTMSWSDRYNASAAPYESPSVIKEWYKNGGIASMNWTSDAVQLLFTGSSPNRTQDGTPQNNPKQSLENPPNTESQTPKIAGGVVGAVAGSIIIAAAVIYLRRRKRRHDTPQDPTMPPELAGDGATSSRHQWPQEMTSDRTLDPNEVPGNLRLPQEVPGSFKPPQEVSGIPIPQELEGGPDSWPSDKEKFHSTHYI